MLLYVFERYTGVRASLATVRSDAGDGTWNADQAQRMNRNFSHPGQCT